MMDYNSCSSNVRLRPSITIFLAICHLSQCRWSNNKWQVASCKNRLIVSIDATKNFEKMDFRLCNPFSHRVGCECPLPGTPSSTAWKLEDSLQSTSMTQSKKFPTSKEMVFLITIVVKHYYKFFTWSLQFFVKYSWVLIFSKLGKEYANFSNWF